jgi:hypothetical protein
MSLKDYAVARDKFTRDSHDGGPPRFADEVAFPCCVGANSEHTDDEEPCRTCDHNVNAVKDEPVSIRSHEDSSRQHAGAAPGDTNGQ